MRSNRQGSRVENVAITGDRQDTGSAVRPIGCLRGLAGVPCLPDRAIRGSFPIACCRPPTELSVSSERLRGKEQSGLLGVPDFIAPSASRIVKATESYAVRLVLPQPPEAAIRP